MVEKKILKICYHDVKIITENEHGLQRLTKHFEEMVTQYSMRSSVEKAKTIVVSSEPRRCELVVNYKVIQQGMEVEYLEGKLSS